MGTHGCVWGWVVSLHEEVRRVCTARLWDRIMFLGYFNTGLLSTVGVCSCPARTSIF